MCKFYKSLKTVNLTGTDKFSVNFTGHFIANGLYESDCIESK